MSGRGSKQIGRTRESESIERLRMTASRGKRLTNSVGAAELIKHCTHPRTALQQLKLYFVLGYGKC